MSPGYAALLGALAIAQFALPLRWGFLPLLITASHLGNLEVIPEFSASRVIILLGLARVMAGGQFNWAFKSTLDRIFIFFSVAAVVSSVGHVADEWYPHPFANHVGLVLNIMGTYLYGRAYLTDIDSFRRFGTTLCLILIPLAGLMYYEMKTGSNMYYYLGGGRLDSASREEKIRAQGPFRGANTAGCVGATSLPFALLFWIRGRKLTALVGLGACVFVTIACNSSGPLSAVAVSVLAVVLWPLRRFLHLFLWSVLFVALLYWVVRGRGPWYLMGSIDLVGGSTGYFRAELIDSGMKYLNEWWLWGTDHTRHWMSTGVSWSPNHTDMTNYYLHLGVIGGLPLTLSLFAILFNCFILLDRRMTKMRLAADPDEPVLWCAGTALAAHAVSFIAISYYDQMSVFFYMLVAAIPGLAATAGQRSSPAPEADGPGRIEPIPVKPLRYYS